MSNRDGRLVTALADVTFSVNAGEYLCLLGRSGCGKSTLLSVISGLTELDAGTIRNNGELVCGPNRHRMLMFQQDALFPWLDVLGNVMYGLQFVERMSRDEMQKKAEAYLDLVGLSNVHHFHINQLSGGMRQRVALARALAPDPNILLMDEPFSALDAMTREQLYADMQRIWKETQKTVIMVTHNAREAACLGTRIILMSAGRVIDDQPISLPHPRTMNDTGIGQTASLISQRLQQKENVESIQ
ncbi:MAG: ABC transporter ATP-binding protein [Deltaproteobacteria bacterium]|jgi:NitT/TauT family transport system ATP-binding protein|nr:ABC transporter ATP-binding protein [Deltaproteobacteria bacterium]